MNRVLLLTCLASALAQVSSLASTISGPHAYEADPNPGGIQYAFLATLSGNDSATFQRHVGAWSWEDNDLFEPGEDPVGWTHTSDWVALTLTESATFTLRLQRQAGVPLTPGSSENASTATMFPSFTVWRGWDNDLAPEAFASQFNQGRPTGDWHTYNNDGLNSWAEDLTELVGYVNNSTASLAEATFSLPAGQYSLVLGSNAPADDLARQGYQATLTTVPEPSAALLGLLGGATLLGRRKRAEQP